MGPRRLHVAHLLQGLNIGGIERMACALAEGMPAARVRSSFVTFDWQGRLAASMAAKGYRVWFRKRRPGWDLRWILWLAKLLREQRVDILQAHNATALWFGWWATWLAPRTCLVYTEHDRAFPSAWRDRIQHRLFARRLAAIVTVSERLRRELLRWEKFPRSRVHVVWNGVALEAPRRSRAEVRQTLGLGESPTVGIVARLAPVKNHALLLQAWERVAQDRPDARLLVIGDGSQRQDLENRAVAAGLTGSVAFLGARDDIPDLLQALDVFVLCSRSEGLSLTLLEAAAMRLPIVATDVGGNREVVIHDRTGLVVPSENVEALAGALARLVQDASLRERLGAAGRERYESHFTLEAMVRSYLRLYGVVSGHPILPDELEAQAPTRAAEIAGERP